MSLIKPFDDSTYSDPFWETLVSAVPVCQMDGWSKVHVQTELSVQSFVKGVSTAILEEFKDAHN